jgi:hypothetical protein
MGGGAGLTAYGRSRYEEPRYKGLVGAHCPRRIDRWALVPVAAMIPFLIWRLFDEERFLAHIEYQKRVRHRLLPFVW